GSTHSSGIAATLSVIWVVAPRRKLEGTNAKRIHRSIVTVGTGGSAAVRSGTPGDEATPKRPILRLKYQAQDAIQQTSMVYPKLQIIVCVNHSVPFKGNQGSISSG